MANRVFVVYLEFSSIHRPEGLHTLQSWLERVFPAQQKHLAIVDNASGGEAEVVSYGLHWMTGDNRWREFSGWDKGISYWRSVMQVSPDDTFVLVNDTFHRSYGTDYLAAFEPAAVARALKSSRLVGHVDAYPREVTVLGLPMRAWIRTSCFVARAGDLERIGRLAAEVDDTALFAENWQAFFQVDAPLSQNYRDYLATWLWGQPAGDDGFGEAWHSQRGLDPATFEDLKGKAKAIICEHYFAARARRRGIGLHPVSPIPPGLLY
jgi:hypothetical protein